MIPDRFLIIFAKAPVAGTVKTRLFPHISPDGAALLQKALIADMVDKCFTLPDIRLWLSYTPEGSAGLFRELLGGRALEYRPQEGDSLGERMSRSFLRAFEEGARSAVIVGTDIPSITPCFLSRSFNILKEKDMVIGPAKDGGYYLIGLKRPVPELFTGISWSGADVLSGTLAKAKRLGLKAGFLPPLSDIDTFVDLIKAASEPLSPRTAEVVAALMRPS